MLQVRFFGTYNFCWIEAHRNLAPLDEEFEDRSSKSKVATFLAGAPSAYASLFLGTDRNQGWLQWVLL